MCHVGYLETQCFFCSLILQGGNCYHIFCMFFFFLGYPKFKVVFCLCTEDCRLPGDLIPFLLTNLTNMDEIITIIFYGFKYLLNLRSCFEPSINSQTCFPRQLLSYREQGVESIQAIPLPSGRASRRLRAWLVGEEKPRERKPENIHSHG